MSDANIYERLEYQAHRLKTLSEVKDRLIAGEGLALYIVEDLREYQLDGLVDKLQEANTEALLPIVEEEIIHSKKIYKIIQQELK